MKYSSKVNLKKPIAKISTASTLKGWTFKKSFFIYFQGFEPLMESKIEFFFR